MAPPKKPGTLPTTRLLEVRGHELCVVPPGQRVQRAWFGDSEAPWSAERGHDVTAKVRDMCSQGWNAMKAETGSLMVDDPAPGTGKSLLMETTEDNVGARSRPVATPSFEVLAPALRVLYTPAQQARFDRAGAEGGHAIGWMYGEAVQFTLSVSCSNLDLGKHWLQFSSVQADATVKYHIQPLSLRPTSEGCVIQAAVALPRPGRYAVTYHTPKTARDLAAVDVHRPLLRWAGQTPGDAPPATCQWGESLSVQATLTPASSTAVLVLERLASSDSGEMAWDQDDEKVLTLGAAFEPQQKTLRFTPSAPGVYRVVVRSGPHTIAQTGYRVVAGPKLQWDLGDRPRVRWNEAVRVGLACGVANDFGAVGRQCTLVLQRRRTAALAADSKTASCSSAAPVWFEDVASNRVTLDANARVTSVDWTPDRPGVYRVAARELTLAGRGASARTFLSEELLVDGP